MIAASTGALAACANPSAPGGNSPEAAIVYNADYNVLQYCDGSQWVALGEINPGAGSGTCTGPAGVEGQMLYNHDHSVFQFCNGEDWIAMGYFPGAGGMGGGGCTAPASCTSIGDVCADGSLFAGFMVYNGSCEPLYVTDNNQSTSSQWKTATGTNDITDPSDKNDAVDGQYNRDNRGAGTFPAFELCENNTYHGKNDWYLPARAELNLLWLNQAAIDANAAGNFTTSTYWSSTENSTTNAWTQFFGFGNQTLNTKTTNDAVRCVRRD